MADLGITASVGSRGDSYDNALAESINVAYKAELIRARKPWRTIEEVEAQYYAESTRASALTTT